MPDDNVDSTESGGSDELFGQPPEEMQAEIDDLIGELSGGSDEDAAADALIDGEEETEGELEAEEAEAEQEDEEGEEETVDAQGADEIEEESDERESEAGDEEEDGDEGDEEPESGTVEALQEQVTALTQFIQNMQNPPQAAAPEPAAEPEAEPEPVEAKPVVLEDILGDLDIDDIVSDKATFTKVLTDYGSKLINATVQQTLLAIPRIVSSQVTQQQSIKSAVDDFYRENTDLENVKPIVGAAANQIQSEHPDWNMEQIFDEAAKRTRKMTGLRKQAISQKGRVVKPATRRKPGLPRKKPGTNRATVGKNNMSKLEKDVLDLIT